MAWKAVLRSLAGKRGTAVLEALVEYTHLDDRGAAGEIYTTTMYVSPDTSKEEFLELVKRELTKFTAVDAAKSELTTLIDQDIKL